MDPLTPVWYGWLRRRFQHGGVSPARGGERSRSGGPALTAAVLVVAATLGLGAVAVAAPEFLTPAQDTTVPDTTVRENAVARGDTEPPETTEEPAAGEPPTAAEDGGDRSEALSAATDQELARLQRSEDPVEAVPELAELRTRAFLAADAGKLDAVNVPGSPAMAADRAELAKLAGTVLSGLAVEVLSAGPAEPAASAAELVNVPATVAISTYQERTADGGTVRSVAALPRQDLVLVLARGPDGWRITDILAPP